MKLVIHCANLSWPGGPTALGPTLARVARTADEGEKLDLVAADPRVYFTIPHFDGYPAVLVHLDRVGVDELAEIVDAAWRTRAPKALLAERISP